MFLTPEPAGYEFWDADERRFPLIYFLISVLF